MTTEIAVSPPGAGIDNFDWRISMATVSSDGAFSRFAGIERTLAILSGDGIALTIGEQPPVTLTPASPPLTFAADIATSAALLGGAVTDLNVMSARGRFTHEVRRFTGTATLAIEPDTIVVVIATEAAALRGAELGPLDAAMLDGATGEVINITATGPAFIALIRPVP